MKKAIFLSVAAAMIVSLAACGTTETETPSTTDSTVISEGTTANQSELVYGTATLTYAEYYAGDVSSTDSYDSVTSATTSKYAIMANIACDFVDEETNADGYHITGVQNVNVAVSADDYEAYLAVNPTFTVIDGEAPTQYKTVTMEDGVAVYGETVLNVADTVTDATAELVTGGNWGDYQINVIDGETVHLRNSREDEFDINSEIQGIILETESGLKVGMEYLQSIWVQPYEVSFNVLEDNSHNTTIAAYDNLTELSKLVGETVTKITYLMPNDAYVYEFEGIYIKPLYSEEITATVDDDYATVTLSSDDFSSFTNGKLTVTYTLGSGRDREVTTLLETELTDGEAAYTVDTSLLEGLESGGIYSATLSSDSYADITIALPATDDQKADLEDMIATAEAKLAEEENESLAEHIEEAKELLANDAAASEEVGSLISELTKLTSDEVQGGGHGGSSSGETSGSSHEKGGSDDKSHSSAAE